MVNMNSMTEELMRELAFTEEELFFCEDAAIITIVIKFFMPSVRAIAC